MAMFPFSNVHAGIRMERGNEDEDDGEDGSGSGSGGASSLLPVHVCPTAGRSEAWRRFLRVHAHLLTAHDHDSELKSSASSTSSSVLAPVPVPVPEEWRDTKLLLQLRLRVSLYGVVVATTGVFPL